MVNVAIVTPVYNTQDYLHRCINSVLKQPGVSLQHFIIDDGSTDNSFAIAQYYQRKDSRVTFISKKNQGQGVARNIGIKLAEAEYIYFVDSDDYLGENTLSKLYQAAKTEGLDICSPDVPKHYFEKPLEYVPCLPCKSQFIRMEILQDFDILQPAIRSGQDGVFSHLVLAHCSRIGMVENAKFHYTHAREGSTFATHLKRHDLVPSLLEQHYAAIEQHYDKYNLWPKNALRLLSFIADESLKNRVEPHLHHLDNAQKQKCFETLSIVAKKAFSYISPAEKKRFNPAVITLATKNIDYLVSQYEKEFMKKNHKTKYYKTDNFQKGQLHICKFADDKLAPAQKKSVPVSEENLDNSNTAKNVVAFESLGVRDIRTEIRTLRGKLDLAINSINNSAIQITSTIRSPAPNLSTGIPDLVVSLTTLPHRLPLVHHAIESIFSQTLLPSKIVLWITDKIDHAQSMLPGLHALVERGLEIRKVEDVGPHTKLLYALKAFPDKCIATVDDDIVYPINAIQCLWGQHHQFPEAVICNWARELAFDVAGNIKGVRAGRLLSPPTLESEIEQAERYCGQPNLLAFPYGTSGVLYPPGALNSCVFEVETFQKICPKEDDIWFKAMTLLNGTPVVVTNLGINPQHHCISGSQHEALRHENHALAKNEIQMKNVFEFFDLYRLMKRKHAISA